MLSGHGTIADLDNDTVHQFEAGEVIHVPPGVEHQVRGDRGTEIVSVGGPSPADSSAAPRRRRPAGRGVSVAPLGSRPRPAHGRSVLARPQPGRRPRRRAFDRGADWSCSPRWSSRATSRIASVCAPSPSRSTAPPSTAGAPRPRASATSSAASASPTATTCSTARSSSARRARPPLPEAPPVPRREARLRRRRPRAAGRRAALRKGGLCVCYDLRFVETAAVLALQGAELVFVPTAWLTGFDQVKWTRAVSPRRPRTRCFRPTSTRSSSRARRRPASVGDGNARATRS